MVCRTNIPAVVAEVVDAFDIPGARRRRRMTTMVPDELVPHEDQLCDDHEDVHVHAVRK